MSEEHSAKDQADNFLDGLAEELEEAEMGRRKGTADKKYKAAADMYATNTFFQQHAYDPDCPCNSCSPRILPGYSVAVEEKTEKQVKDAHNANLLAGHPEIKKQLDQGIKDGEGADVWEVFANKLKKRLEGGEDEKVKKAMKALHKFWVSPLHCLIFTFLHSLCNPQDTHVETPVILNVHGDETSPS